MRIPSDSVSFLTRNILHSLRLRRFSTLSDGDIVFRAYTQRDRRTVRSLYIDRNRADIGVPNRLLLSLLGGKLCLVAATPGTEIVGIAMFYFNRRDISEATIHEGFIGVRGSHEGRGVATRMRLLAKRHFSAFGLGGISTRITAGNRASLRSAEKAGFVTVEAYNDGNSGEARVYMVMPTGTRDQTP